MVGPDLHRVPSIFQVMSPFLQANDGKHFGVMDLIVALH
jgi:hypothetical protein